MRELKEQVSSNNFSMAVEQMAIEKKCTIIEATILYCNDREIEVESVPSLCNDRLKNLIRLEGEQNFMVKKDKNKVKPVI